MENASHCLELALNFLDYYQQNWMNMYNNNNILLYSDALHDLIQRIENQYKVENRSIPHLKSYKEKVQSLLSNSSKQQLA